MRAELINGFPTAYRWKPDTAINGCGNVASPICVKQSNMFKHASLRAVNLSMQKRFMYIYYDNMELSFVNLKQPIFIALFSFI